jgi:hypothetical protein
MEKSLRLEGDAGFIGCGIRLRCARVPTQIVSPKRNTIAASRAIARLWRGTHGRPPGGGWASMVGLVLFVLAGVFGVLPRLFRSLLTKLAALLLSIRSVVLALCTRLGGFA